MSWKLADDSGRVLIGSADGGSGSSDLYTGTGIENASLSVRSQKATFQPMGAAYPQEDVVTKQYQITFSAGLDTDDIVVALRGVTGSKCYVTYYNAEGTVLFAGNCIWDDLGSEQRQGQHARQSATLSSTGAPDVG